MTNDNESFAEPRFRLHWTVIGVGVLVAASYLALAWTIGEARLGGPALMAAAGRAVGIFVGGLLAGFLVWRFLGESYSASNIATAVVAAGLGAWAASGAFAERGNLFQLSDGRLVRRDDPAAIVQIIEPKLEELLGPLGKIGATESSDRLMQASKIVREETEKAPEWKKGLAAIASILEGSAKDVREFNESIHVLAEMHVLEPATSASRDELETRMARLEGAIASRDTVRRRAHQIEARYRELLSVDDQQLPAEDPSRQLLKGAISKHLPELPNCFEPAASSFDSCKEIYKTLGQSYGQWTYDAALDEVVFSSETASATVSRYNEMRGKFFEAMGQDARTEDAAARRKRLETLLKMLKTDAEKRDKAGS